MIARTIRAIPTAPRYDSDAPTGHPLGHRPPEADHRGGQADQGQDEEPEIAAGEDDQCHRRGVPEPSDPAPASDRGQSLDAERLAAGVR